MSWGGRRLRNLVILGVLIPFIVNKSVWSFAFLILVDYKLSFLWHLWVFESIFSYNSPVITFSFSSCVFFHVFVSCIIVVLIIVVSLSVSLCLCLCPAVFPRLWLYVQSSCVHVNCVSCLRICEYSCIFQPPLFTSCLILRFVIFCLLCWFCFLSLNKNPTNRWLRR